ncbi:hypothetical protein DL764_007433 [Monosporascus ibericus]|uniref:Uncharacterized protein n=1 Tax=Monosporascus ibericus TaxID=155417 RepID=A0A4Q4T3I5_9PEZI|nr:hypothetical protein DL764_007433 [Monosporascus ibericus]
MAIYDSDTLRFIGLVFPKRDGGARAVLPVADGAFLYVVGQAQGEPRHPDGDVGARPAPGQDHASGQEHGLAFINKTRNTKDAVSIMKEVGQVGRVCVGVVMSVTTSKSGDQIATVCMTMKDLKIWGQAMEPRHQVQGREADPARKVVDHVTGERVVRNMLVNRKHLTRGVGRLVREMNACASRFDSIQVRGSQGVEIRNMVVFKQHFARSSVAVHKILRKFETELTYKTGSKYIDLPKERRVAHQDEDRR